MTAANWQRALDFVLHFEGGYTCDPADPGGATNFGITHEELIEWRKCPTSIAEVEHLTREEAAEIFKANYWRLMHCEELPSGIDLMTFDCAVNQGVDRAARILQHAVGVNVDGQIGPQTLAAIHRAPLVALLIELAARRMDAYGLLQQLFPRFGLGWSRRLAACLLLAETLLGRGGDGETQA